MATIGRPWLGGDFAGSIAEVFAKVVNSLPISLVRFGDGELALMQGKPVGSKSQAFKADGWSAPEGMTKLGKALNEVAENRLLIQGIPCDCCNAPAKAELAKLCRGQPTWANIFINSNHAEFVSRIGKLSSVGKSVFLIGYNASTLDASKFPAQLNGLYSVRSNCVTWFEQHAERLKSDMRLIADRWKSSVILVAAGPMANVLVHWLWEANPDIQALDIGSALDEWIHGRKTRPYQHEGNEYRLRVCR